MVVAGFLLFAFVKYAVGAATPSEVNAAFGVEIFSDENLDINFVKERCDAAYQYFFKTLDCVAEELLLKIEEVKRIKKVKAFYDELVVLEELQIKVFSSQTFSL